MLAIDLFCGLTQAQFRLGADALVEQFMARWTQNPDHMALTVAHEAPRPVAFVPRLMRHFDNARFAARFARQWNIRVSAPESSGDADKVDCVGASKQALRNSVENAACACRLWQAIEQYRLSGRLALKDRPQIVQNKSYMARSIT